MRKYWHVPAVANVIRTTDYYNLVQTQSIGLTHLATEDPKKILCRWGQTDRWSEDNTANHGFI